MAAGNIWQVTKTFLFIQLNLRREPHLTLFVHVVVQDKCEVLHFILNVWFFWLLLVYRRIDTFLFEITH